MQNANPCSVIVRPIDNTKTRANIIGQFFKQGLDRA